MSSWYRNVAALADSPLAPLDEALAARLEGENLNKLMAIEEKIKDAEENLGESEVRDAQMEKAAHIDNVGD